MASIDTSKLPVVLDGPAGPNEFFVARMDGYEAVSEPFTLRLELLSFNKSVDLDSQLGKSFTLKVKVPDKKETFLNGMARRVRSLGMEGEFAKYEIELVPQLWTLGLQVNSRIFQEKSVPDIVSKVLGDGSVKFEKQLNASYKAREYCVQYQESDLAFVSRLLEEEGIFYWFKHENGKHTMMLDDKSSGAPKCPQVDTYEWMYASGGAWTASFVTRFERERSLRAGAFASSDYNFKTPTTNLTVKKTGKDKPEVFEYPGVYIDRGGGEALAKVHLEEMEWQRETVSGEGSCRTMRSGHAFTLKKQGAGDAEYFLTQVHHVINQSGDFTAGMGGADFESIYEVTFQAIPSKVPYRPQRLTPRPRVYGSQPAVVTGKSGEEIWTDKYGRIKVQFFWDREGKKDENSSCWIRCAFGVAGKQWGQIFIPRIGQEVLVAFLDGDPDCPVVVGGLYNDSMMPPYSLPGEMTKSTLKSRSTKGGGASNFNEIRLEDKKGSEQIFIQAEKDMHRLVKNDDKLEVRHDQTIDIKNHRTETVKDGNETVTVTKGNRVVTIEQGNETLDVKMGTRTVTIFQDDTLQVKMGSRSVKIFQNDSLKVEAGSQTIEIAMKQDTKANLEIKLTVGASSIKIDNKGVEITGPMVKISGTASCEIMGNAMTKIESGGMLKAGAPITMIG